jgi:hypothetical protein
MTEPLPTLDLRLETAMVNPPKPIGFVVVDGGRMVGVMTIETVRLALSAWDAANAERAQRKTEPQ